MRITKIFKCLSGLFLLVLTSCSGTPLFQCDTVLHDQSVSSSGRLKTGVVDAQCGATTEDASWVLLTEENKDFDYKKDRIATFEGQIKSVVWHQDELVITYGKAKPFLTTQQAKGIHIIYRQ